MSNTDALNQVDESENIPIINTTGPRVQELQSKEEDTSAFTYICLTLILLISMGNQWQRYLISYANGIGSPDGDAKYEILTAYPELKNQGTYGLLAGLAFTLSFATFGVFGGYLSDKYNRKMLIVVAGVAWSLCTFLSGLINSFAVLFVLRFFLGIFESGFNPCAYSMIADMFHPNKRTTAAAIFNLGIYFGGALASLSSIMIKTIGWRQTYEIVGVIGVAFSILALFIVKEPVRGAFDAKKKDDLDQIKLSSAQKSPLELFVSAASELFVNPTCRWATIGGSFRFFGGYSIAFFMPKFFNAIYPDEIDKDTKEVIVPYTTYYFIANAFIVSLCGFVSSIVGGKVSDHYEKKGYYMIKAYVCIFAGLAGIPTSMFCLLFQNNFWFSILFLALEYLTAECFFSPAIAMVLNTITPGNRGFAVSAYLFCCTIAGTLATWLLGQLQTAYKADEHPEYYGKILFIFIVISYGGSLPFFYLAGKTYTSIKKKEKLAELKASEGF